jgi:Alpha/beta hydrolase domain
MFHPFDHQLLRLVLPIVTLLCAGRAPAQAGHIDAGTWVCTSQGTFGGIPYTRHEAMFAGVTSNNRAFRVPCQIIAPTNSGQGSGLMLFDWLVPSTIPTAVGQEQADARYTMTDAFLFGRGVAYATVRCDPAGIGRRSPVSNPTRPWSDGLLDTSSEFIMSAADEFDIVVAYLDALRTDPLAVEALGPIQRRAAFAYSAAGYRLRGLLRMRAGIGLFDFSLVGGTGDGYAHPEGNDIGFTHAEREPLAGAGLEIDFQSETDVVVLGADKTRHEEPNYRVYQFAGTAHLRAVDAAEFGLADPSSANTADQVPFFRALFVAGNRWCDGFQPPPSLWLGAPNDARIVRDANGNALVTHVGGLPVNTTGYRLPAVAVGENQYVPFAPSYNTGPFLGWLRALAGGHVDLTGHFISHAGYVAQITQHACGLQELGYLLATDAAAIVLAADQSSIGN